MNGTELSSTVVQGVESGLTSTSSTTWAKKSPPVDRAEKMDWISSAVGYGAILSDLQAGEVLG
jgi:hypothetical protein